MTYADVKDLKPADFKRFCGVKPHTFAAMVEALPQREQQKKKKSREPNFLSKTNCCCLCTICASIEFTFT